VDTLIIAYISAFIFGFSYRYLIRKFAPKNFKKNAKPNIGNPDKLLRLFIAAVLLVFGIYFNNFILLFFSGFTLFEAIFSWCGFYAAIGKNTCPLE
jgi:uncharacterized membrane protein